MQQALKQGVHLTAVASSANSEGYHGCNVKLACNCFGGCTVTTPPTTKVKRKLPSHQPSNHLSSYITPKSKLGPCKSQRQLLDWKAISCQRRWRQQNPRKRASAAPSTSPSDSSPEPAPGFSHMGLALVSTCSTQDQLCGALSNSVQNP
jgi:hypothetical protein